ncbi:molybdenum cofactor guanylyltransferase [Edaphobacter aggregans]|uniref:molybdenum cofactor guanylyltransferase n=1 Tax=Edaphobacter aggregans TaxID=570835 RepID=UPI00068FA304|nr:molybdenum cofactor guanylyltransferase [Edaphobacter aggregans]
MMPELREERLVGGYVLAGGRSTRMGRDKALLQLGGEPLVQHAVRKLRRLTGEVHILSDRPELAEFAPLVPDLHPGCGPVSGMEAALAHSRCDWTLVLPVDMPFLPAILLERWMRSVVELPKARAALFTVEGLAQAALCLLHRELAPFVRTAVEQRTFKLYTVFEAAAVELALKQGAHVREVLLNREWDDRAGIALSAGESGGDPWTLSEAQQRARHLWFANLNTPEEFAEAERHVDALDT